MDIVIKCQVLGLSYTEFMKQPKWWTELSIEKRLVDNSSGKQKAIVDPLPPLPPLEP